MFKSTRECLALLRAYKENNASRYGISRIGIFGSVARGEDKRDSDIDIYYEGKPQSLVSSFDLHGDLEKLFGRKVDLIRKHSNMNKYLQERINKELIDV